MLNNNLNIPFFNNRRNIPRKIASLTDIKASKDIQVLGTNFPSGTDLERILTRLSTERSDGYRPYKIYVALLNQSGTNAPTATILENTLGATITWTRNSAGSYVATASISTFAPNKTVVTIGQALEIDFETTVGLFTTYQYDTTTTLKVGVLDGGLNYLDDSLVNCPIEIRVYP